MERCGDKEKERDQRWKTPKGPTGTWAQAEGGKGGRTDAGHVNRSTHAVQGADTSDIG